MFDETWFHNGEMCWFCLCPIMAKVGIRQMTGGGGMGALCGNVVISCYTAWRWRSPVSWLLLCKVACYRNKVKARGKNVGWSQLRGLQSTVTPSIWAQQGASQHSKSSKAWQKYYSSASTSNLGTRMTPTRANIKMFILMLMEEPSDSWLLTTTYNRSW